MERLKFSWNHSKRAALLDKLRTCNADLDKLRKALDGAKPFERKQQSRRAHQAFESREVIEQLYAIMCRACSCQPSKPRDLGLGLRVRPISSAHESESCFQLLLFDSSQRVCELSAKIARAEPEPPRKKIRFEGPALTRKSKPQPKTKLVDLCKEHHAAQQTCSRLQLLVDKNGTHIPPSNRPAIN